MEKEPFARASATAALTSGSAAPRMYGPGVQIMSMYLFPLMSQIKQPWAFE